MDRKPFISVSIRTLNESKCIEKTVDSIRKQLVDHPYKITVADSLSTDNTQQLAIDKGVIVMSLTDPGDHCCGVGHQSGYLYSEGEYLSLMDGDMELEEGFVDQAVAFLQAEPEYAGVAGTVEMDDAINYEFKSCKQRISRVYPLGDSDHLGGDGLYRRSVVEKIDYLTNRNLHAYEEAELGLRLIETGYKLRRLDIPYFSHTSHILPTFKMLARRWASGYYQAPDELLRCSWGKPWFSQLFNIMKNEVVFALCLIPLLVATLSLNTNVFAVALLPLLAFALLKIVQNRSLTGRLQSVINLIIRSAGLIKDIFYPVRDSLTPPNSKIIHEQPGQAP